ncbi:HAD-superfamily subfamily IIA hydrolase [Plectosphaerella plurivora]|uniref:HAD-superfamily subfamily IIA hydrolase n=1 Tax=Plectosphaerella plurivora TaxID=936078 RepID=A0A9P8VCA5_9PEZI|nr:HAD-superfamily subfamily IIA hydrolase [Plectosphaerella plurivora]
MRHTAAVAGLAQAARLTRPTTSSATLTKAKATVVAGRRYASGARVSDRALGWTRSIQTARPRLPASGARYFSTPQTTQDPVFHAGEAPSFAFAFDIDGVLLHVAKPIPGATEALKYLQDNNIPFILLTNGGGKHETDRVKDLSAKLGLQLSVDNFVQSHTPFQELVHGPESLSDKTVLVTGANAQKCRAIAERYGFKSVITPADILRAHPDVWPFEPLMEDLYERTARPLPRPLHNGRPEIQDVDALKVDAMFVFNDPRDWALDIQIIMDLLLSRQGIMGTYSSKNGNADLPNGGWQQDGQPPLIFSNADLFWSTTYHQPRFGQGAFQAAIGGIWSQVTGGRELQKTVYGKPFAETYKYAERVLNTHRAQLLGSGGNGGKALTPLKTVYMVGDNPESDIRGANEYESKQGTDWTSVLVRTGVWTPERGDGGHKAKKIVDDVKAAVAWALKREGL